MSLSEKTRSKMYEVFRPQLGEEEAQEMLSCFPSGDTKFVTTDYLDNRLTELSASLRIEMHDGFRRQTMWLAAILGGTVVGGMGLAAGIAAAVAN